MKIRTLVCSLFPLALMALCFGQPSQGPARRAVESQTPNYTITITPPSAPMSLKSPLLVEVYFTNITDSDIGMVINYGNKTISLLQIVLTKDGKEVETTPLQRIRTGRGTPSDFLMYRHDTNGDSISRLYPPGVFWKSNHDLRALYNITKPGQYKMTAYRTEKTEMGEIVVRSNEVMLVIVP